MFVPTLIEVPIERPLSEYLKTKVPVLDQGSDGACTGFGLATVVHYLLRRRAVYPDKNQVSPRMLYNMARRYDEWPGEHYSGSSARGAMKGWHKHGVCSRLHWVYDRKHDGQDGKLFSQRYVDALRRPLGSYFRVNHKDIVAMHAAISEAGILFATAQVHDGWNDVHAKGRIPWNDSRTIEGGHAFAIVGYDENGFWIQNSWGTGWGRKGFGQICYDDWLANGSDVWVARLGAPIVLRATQSVSRGIGVAAQGTRSYMFPDLQPHIISLGNDGRLRPGGTYGTSRDDVADIFRHIATVCSQPKGPKRLLLYAHGGLTAEDSAIQKVADLRSPLLDAGTYPLAFIWKTDFWTTLKYLLQDAIGRRRPEGFLDGTKDFMLDRLDDMLEPLARVLGGKRIWEEMKENATLASATPEGGLLAVREEIVGLLKSQKIEIHLVGHSAGSILLGGLVSAMAQQKIPITSCTLWAPACTNEFYRKHYLPAIKSNAVKRFAVFALKDKQEQDDHCANIYHKSLLYLVSRAFEKLPVPGMPNAGRFNGEPLLGMQIGLERLAAGERTFDIVFSPNEEPDGSRNASQATAHGSFDDDATTLKATLARVLDQAAASAEFGVGRLRSESTNRARRQLLVAESNPVLR